MNENTPSPITKRPACSFWRWFALISFFVASWILSTATICFEIGDRVTGSEFLVGEPAPRTVFSAFEFSYENQANTQALRDLAGKSSEPVFQIQSASLDAAYKTVNDFLTEVEKSQQKKTATPAPQPEAIKPPFELSKALWHAVFEENLVKDLKAQWTLLVREALHRGYFDPSDKKTLLDLGVKQVVLLLGNDPALTLQTADLYTSDDPKRFVESVLNPDVLKNKSLRNALIDLWTAFSKPLAFKSEKETVERQKKMMDSVNPVMNKIKKNEMVAQRGMLITQEGKDRLERLEKEMQKHRILNQLFFIAGFVALLYGLAFLAFYLFIPKSFFVLRQTGLFHASVITTLIISKAIYLWPGASAYLMPTALASLLLILLSGPFAAMVGTLMLTGLIALLTKFNIEVVLATLISGCAALLSGQKIRKRSQLLKVGAAIGLSYAIILFLLKAFAETPAVEALQISLQGLINGALTIVIGYLLASFFEAVFDLTTDIYLLEMSDLNHPLMKRMIVEAPGTYHHSLVVSTLAEAACEAIGANSLLARVGCYFHDIGKIAEAEYFTENSLDTAKLRHEVLSPFESSAKIMNHVRGGIELGKKHKLKQPILDFIPEHQGTGVVYYFYRRALDESKPGQKIDIHQYRYPGPKPQTRETAVALLSDSTEAASRSLKDPNPDSIRRLVRKIINDKFIDGQLDECNLTLKDLHRIQESFVQNLMAIFHTRVAYPEKPPMPDQVDIFCDHSDH